MENTLNNMPGNDEKHKAIKVLEINPNHELFKNLSTLSSDEDINFYSNLLYDQAMLIQGFQIKDPENFSKLLTELMLKSLNK